MRRLVFSLVPVAAVALVLACGGEKEKASEAESPSELIGGRPATEAEFPATLLIKGNCTATRVGPRHILTAAHCVADKFAAGSAIEITSDNATGKFGPDGGASFKTYKVERTTTSPSWTQLCPTLTSCGSVHVSGRNNMADAALIVVTEDITNIAQAAIDLSPVDNGDPVVITGYGCEDAVGGSWDYAHQRLRVAPTTVRPFDTVLHAGSFIFEEDRASGLFAQMAGIYAITPGPTSVIAAVDGGGASDSGASDSGAPESGAADAAASDSGSPSESRAGLCPGDSGGPLYRGDAPGLTVVGINASYTFSTGRPFQVGTHSFLYGGSPVTNWHTRVDGTRGLAVGGWLKQQGVRTVCTRGGC